MSWGSVSTNDDEDVIRYRKKGPFKQVFSNRHAWAAIRSDGKLITWGRALVVVTSVMQKMTLRMESSEFSQRGDHSPH